MFSSSSFESTVGLQRAGGAADVLDSPAPAVAGEDAERIAQRHFGVTGTARNLASERDTNFHIVTADAHGYVLKFANPAEPPENTNFQTEALLYLERTDPTLPVPKVITALNGAHELTLPLCDGRDSVVRLLTWVEGEQLARANVSTALRHDIGGTLARLGVALRAYDHPASAHYILWDIKNASQLREMTPAIEEAALRYEVEAKLEKFEIDVAPRLAGLRQQVIHNDLNHYNVVVDPDNLDRISGILDFGDMVKSALVIDVAVAASYVCALDDDALESVTDVVTAYHAVTPLTRDELELMHDLIVARLLTTICIANWRAQRYPHNAEYILRNNEPARRGLERFGSLPREVVTRCLLHACARE